MMRAIASALAVIAFASAASAQPPDPFRPQPIPAPPTGMSWRLDNPLAVLGQKLFFDGRLSYSGRTACASCHNPSYTFSDPRRVSISDNGRPGTRNAPSLMDVGEAPWLMWDGRFRTLEQQAMGPFHSGEMGVPYGEAVRRVTLDPEYAHLFRTTIGSPPMIGSVAHAISTFQRALVSPTSRVDRFVVNNERAILNAQEQHGFDVFMRRAGCANCHQPFPSQQSAIYKRPLFTDFQFHNLGVGYGPHGFADTGRAGHTMNQAETGAFRTPPLRNAARTPPYMHDGSFATLEEVVEFYDAGGRPNPYLSPQIRPLGLSPQEKAALVAFIRAMADPAPGY
jgi:cytochrome c peroxidase